MKTTIRLAGAQIPVGTDIQTNKKEIFKALDWAKETGVDFANFKDVRVGPSNEYNHLKPKNYIACKDKNIR